MEQNSVTPTEEVKVEKVEMKMRDEETLEKLNPKKMNQKELVFMLGKCRAERDAARTQLESTKIYAEKAFKKARESEEGYNSLVEKINTTFGFIEKSTENFKDSINLVIKGRI